MPYLRAVFACVCLLTLPLHADVFENVSTYEELQAKISGRIHRSEQNLWIATRSFQDSYLIEALASAQNRKIQVRLLLAPPLKEGKDAAKYFDSFRQQKLSFILDPDLRVETTTAILVDKQLIWINTLFDRSEHATAYTLQTIENEKKIEAYRRYFESRSNLNITDTQRLTDWNQLPSVFEPRKQPLSNDPQTLPRKLPKQLKSDSSQPSS